MSAPASPERFEAIAIELGLDDFQRIAAYDLVEQLRTDPHNEQLLMELGAICAPSVEGWAT